MKPRVPISVDACAAKTGLIELLDRVEAGGVIVITRHGSPVATMQPFEPGFDAKRAQGAIDGLLALRSEFLDTGPSLSLDDIRSAIGRGRK